MKAGEKTVCPHCGESTIAKKEMQMDGWTKVGEILICTLCRKKLSDLIDDTDKQATDQKSIGDLARLFNDDQGLKRPKFESDGTEKPFCRDCVHYISHPFMDRCTLHGKGVNPMDDCEDFERKEVRGDAEVNNSE